MVSNQPENGTYNPNSVSFYNIQNFFSAYRKGIFPGDLFSRSQETKFVAGILFWNCFYPRILFREMVLQWDFVHGMFLQWDFVSGMFLQWDFVSGNVFTMGF